MKQKMKTIALIAIIVMTAFVAICAFPSAAVEEDTSDKISGYLKYTMKQGYLEMEPVEKPDITEVGKPVKPLKIAVAEDKVAKGVKGVRERETLPSVIGGVITTESPLTEDQVKQLESLGVEIRSRMGTVTTVNMPKDKIQDIASLDYIRYIEGARPVRMHLDAAVPEMGADQAWADGYTGDGVIIGIADTGIDVNHGDFYFDAAKTDSKILYLWDQDDSTGPTPALYGYGTEWTKAQIDAGSCTETDTDGHGTHVAGIAASTGLETGNYPGVAPDANIIFVKTTFWDIDIIDGWQYIVERAQAEGKPCVISCSIGAYFSPHDGTDPLAQAADWCAAQGVLVICSAGNDGDWPVHATIQQPRTEIWSDDFDSGFGEWVTDGGAPTWQRVTDRSTSSDYSTYPGTCMDICKYVNNQYSTMTMASSIDLSTTTSPVLSFELWSEIEYNCDYLDVDVSSDGGATWTNVAWYDGDMGWTGQSIDLSPYTSDQVKVRFRFVSDYSYTYEGPYIDDVVISDGATTLWSDDFESGFGDWVTDGGDPTWHQEDSRSYGGSYSAYPGTCKVCEYVNDQDSTMTMASSIDLSTTTYPVLAFELWSDIEWYYDFLYVDVSSDGGTNWREVWSYGDHDRNWRGMIVDLTPYKSDQVKVRFRFVSDYIYTYEGPYIDDVAIYEQSGVCGGTYAEGETYHLEVALDPWARWSLVDLYYDLDDNVSIEVRTYNGYVTADEADAYGFGDDWVIEVYYVEGLNWKNYFIYAYDEDPSCNEMIEIHVDAVNPGGVNRWDAWTLPPFEEWLGYFRDVDDMDYFMSVGSPASAHNVIAVGAYTTKDCWDNIDGDHPCYPLAMMDDLAYYSSHGPTRDCRMKPELTESGFGVMSALSGDSSSGSVYVDPDGAHQMMAGTSMSAPMVAGAVAFGLECNPDASPSELRSYFMETAREDAYTGDTWPGVDNQYWGAGKIWSDPPCLHLSKTDDVEGDCVDPGAMINYTICYDNRIGRNDVHNVTINDTLPAGVTFVSASGTGGYDAGTRNVTWTIGTVLAGATEKCVTLNVTVNTGTEGQTLENCAIIDSDETYPAEACETTDVCTAEPTPTPTPEPTPTPTPVPVLPTPTPVPVLTPAGVALMIGLLAVAGFVTLRRRE